MLVAHLFLHEAVSIPMLNQMRDIRMPQTVQSQLFRQPSFGAKLGKPAIKITPRDASPSLGDPNSIKLSWIKPVAGFLDPLPHTWYPPVEFWNKQDGATSRRAAACGFPPSHMHSRVASPMFGFGVVVQICEIQLCQLIPSQPKCVGCLEYLGVSKRGQRAFLP